MERKEYNNGFKIYYYQCEHCGSESVSQIQLGGFQPPKLVCDRCDSNVTDTPIVIEYLDNNNIAPKTEPQYSEKEVVGLFNKFLFENVIPDGNPMNIFHKFPNWFDENKKKVI